MAPFFIDSSALVKRYVQELGSGWVGQLAAPAAGNLIQIVSLTAVEVVSAIARRQRGGTISAADAALVLADFQHDLAHQYWNIEITPQIIGHALTLARTHALRGSDAVQLAAALEARAQVMAQGQGLTVVSADAELNAAAAAEGLAVDDPNRHP